MEWKEAIGQAVDLCKYWLGGAVIVYYDDLHTCEAVPGAILKDISWTGHEHDWRVLFELSDPCDVAGADYEDSDRAAVVEMIADAIAQQELC